MKQNKKIALLICIALCLAIASSAFYIVGEADHHCIGKECHVCIKIFAYVSLLNSIAFAMVIFGGVIAAIYYAYCVYRQLAIKAGQLTLVTLKVKLSN